jgi:hypothetical protein
MAEAPVITTLSSIQNDPTAVSTLNTNFANIVTVFSDVLSLSGVTPNQMLNVLDMNSNQIINLPNPATANSPLRLSDLNKFIGGGTISNIPAGGLTGDALVKTSNADYAIGWSSNVVITGPGSSVVNDLAVWNNTSGTLLKDATGLSAVAGGPLTINPTVNSLNQGLTVTQTSPTSGNPTGPFSFNLINATWNSGLSGSFPPAPVSDFGDYNTAVSGFRTILTIGGANMKGEAITAIRGSLRHTTPSTCVCDKVAILGTAYLNTTIGDGVLEAFTGGVMVDVGGVATGIFGLELDIGILPGGSAVTRGGVIVNGGITTTSTVRGSSLDAAYIVSSGAGASWNNGLYLADGLSNNQAINTTGSIIAGDGTHTITNGIYLPNWTVTGLILQFQHVGLTGGGALALTGNATAGITVTNIQNATSTINITNTSNGNAAAAAFTINNDIGLTGILGMTSSGFSLGLGNNVLYLRSTSLAAGIAVEADGTGGVFFGTNSIERGRFLLGFMVGTQTDPGVGVINVLTGYRIGNAAASGHYLRGNGTSYIDGTIASGDLPGGSIVNSVSNSDGTLTISPTTGAVVASLNLAHANTWTASPQVMTVNQVGSTQWNLNNNNAGGITDYTAQNDVASATAAFGIAGSAQSLITGLSGYAFVYASAQTNGINIYSTGAKPIVFSISAAEVGRWDGTTAGLLKVGLLNTTLGQVQIFGNTSGSAIITVQAGAGTPTLTLGTSSGTPAVTASSPLVITTATGNITCPTCATTTNGGALSATSPITISAAGVIAIGAPYGATSYTSNGILYGNGSSNISVTAQGGANTILVANAGAPSFSASPTIGTSVTTPLDIGGTAAGSTKEIRSTTGTGSGDKVLITGGTNGGTTIAVFYGTGTIGLGTANVPTNTALLGSRNVTNISGAIGDGTNSLIHIINADGSPTNIKLSAFGAGGGNTFVATYARGTAASPITLNVNDQVFGFGPYAYDGAQYDLAGAIGFQITAITANTNVSGAIRFLGVNANNLHAAWITPNGGLMLQDIVTYSSTNDPGAGGLYVDGQIYGKNITQTAAAQTGTLCWSSGSSPSGKFTVDTTLACLSSSARWKQDIEPWEEEALPIIEKLKPSKFGWKTPLGINQEGEQIGLIAEQVWEVDQRLGGVGSDNMPRAWRQDTMITVLTKAIQELQNEIKQLKKENNDY